MISGKEIIHRKTVEQLLGYAERTNERKKNVGDKSKISRAGTHRCSFWLVGGKGGYMKVGGWVGLNRFRTTVLCLRTCIAKT